MMAGMTLAELENTLGCENPGGGASTGPPTEKDINAIRKLLVPDANKIGIIQQHRLLVARDLPKIQQKMPVVAQLTITPSVETAPATGSSFKDSVPSGLKPIFLSQMEPHKDKVYGKRLLRLTLIEDPMMGFTATNFVVEDDEGTVTRLSIYNIPQNEEFGKLLAFGSQLGIINPYHRLAAGDGKPVIRVDDPDKVIHLGMKNKMCRYCGQEGAGSKCAKCSADYCSRICQLADWKIMKHKLVCKKKEVKSAN